MSELKKFSEHFRVSKIYDAEGERTVIRLGDHLMSIKADLNMTVDNAAYMLLQLANMQTKTLDVLYDSLGCLLQELEEKEKNGQEESVS